MTQYEFTSDLRDWQGGDRAALSRIVPEMYQELRRTATGCLRREWRGQTLGPTVLIHEAYLVLAKARPFRCHDRSHFTAIVKRLMRQIVIQYARRRGALKRGGADFRVTLDEDLARAAPSALNDFDSALQNQRRRQPRTHLIVEMHYRGGYTVEEIARSLALSVRSVERELHTGRSWLEGQLTGYKQ